MVRIGEEQWPVDGFKFQIPDGDTRLEPIRPLPFPDRAVQGPPVPQKRLGKNFSLPRQHDVTR